MTVAALRTLLGIRRRAIATVLAACTLVSCASVEPRPTIYVLGSPASSERKTESLLGRPILEVKPVHLPDYIDVTDILIRRPDNVLDASRTGRWAERLSAGVTRAFAAGLESRLTYMAVTTGNPGERQYCQTVVDVETFERSVEGAVVFAAQWRLLGSDSDGPLVAERVTLAESGVAENDAAIVAAMSRTIDAFAEQVAAGIIHLRTACTQTSKRR